MSEVRGGGWEELPQAPTPEATGGSLSKTLKLCIIDIMNYIIHLTPKMKVSVSCSVVFDSLQPHEL